MVVDTELEDAKSAILDLTKEKEQIEAEWAALSAVLASNGVGMEEPLVDSEGYPRNDIDVYRVRHARHKIICLRNDHKAIMKKIEQGLAKIHVCSTPLDAKPSVPREMLDRAEVLPMEPFLRVDLVSPGSPAEIAGIRRNDRIMQFGSINYRNYKSLTDIASLVEHSRYKPIIVRVKRDEDAPLSLTLIPRPWSGKGLLGCNVVPSETVER